MDKKKLIAIGVLSGILVCGAISAFVLRPVAKVEETKISQVETESTETVQAPQVQQGQDKVVFEKKKKILYAPENNQDMPLSAIANVTKLPEDIKSIVHKIIKDSEVYYLNVSNGKVLIIKSADTDEERVSRHDFEILKVDLESGQIEKELNFPQKMSNEESENEVWQYEVLEGDMVVPSSHTSLKNGKQKFQERWYYNSKDSLKYKVTNDKNKTLSIRKTSPAQDGNWRDEHIFYDEDGNTLLNVSTVYENNRLARFNYYEDSAPEEGITIVSEYMDGEKTKEVVYSSDYKVKNTYEAVYDNGERKEVKVLDSNNVEIENFEAE